IKSADGKKMASVTDHTLKVEQDYEDTVFKMQDMSIMTETENETKEKKEIIYLPADDGQVITNGETGTTLGVTMMDADKVLSVSTGAKSLCVNINATKENVAEVKLSDDSDCTISLEGESGDQMLITRTVGEGADAKTVSLKAEVSEENGAQTASTIEISEGRIANENFNFSVLLGEENQVPASQQIPLTNLSAKTKSAVSYTGENVYPAVEIKDGNYALKEWQDFVTVYMNNRDLGTARVILIGMGKYRGEKELTFVITDQEIADQGSDQPSGGNGGNSGNGSSAGQSDNDTGAARGGQGKDTAAQSGQSAAVGSKLTDTTTGNSFKVTKDSASAPEVCYVGPSKKAADAKTVVIDKSVTINGVKYTVTGIADKALKGNKKVTKVTIADSVTAIGKNAFSGCVNLKTVKGGKNVKTIGANAFSGCGKLKGVTIGKKVTTIGNSAFMNCTKLKKVTIPSLVKKIGKKAFYGCSRLSGITIQTKKLTYKNVGAKAFAMTAAKPKVKTPKGKKTAYHALLLKKGLSKKARF
ncbi:MAG: leucine-rich repeat domain-containing protein, partial [Lachnospiraceae bacterium]|nr:leucine-rich repeat domain-containing protein [Lachnospiraceae bacterium]